MGKLLSIIIPTYNRRDILKKCLIALFNQAYSVSNFEAIVIDDGSTDGTKEEIEHILSYTPVELKYFKQGHKGPTAARNIGIRNAKGDVILFLGDDIIAEEHLLEEHYKFHMQTPENNALLGLIKWHPDLKINPFMDFLSRDVQFGYRHIKDKENLPFYYFITSNVSIKRSFLIKNDLYFDEDFIYPILDDFEFAYRLKDKGMVLRYNPQALGYHYHQMQFKKYCLRQELMGCYLVVFSRKHPQMIKSIVPQDFTIQFYTIAIRRFIAFCILPLVIGINNRWLYDKCFENILNYYKMLGIKRELKGNG